MTYTHRFHSSKKNNMALIKDFKTFISQGNVIELAVAVIIGGAFANIVSSLVDDMITPLLLTPALRAAKVHEITQLTYGEIKYGNFLAASIKFVLIAIVLFLLLKAMRGVTKTEPKSEAL